MDYPCACTRVFWAKQPPFFFSSNCLMRNPSFPERTFDHERSNFSTLKIQLSQLGMLQSLCELPMSSPQFLVNSMVRWSHAGLDFLHHREGAWSPRGRQAGKMSNFLCMQQFIMQLSWIEILCPEMGVIKLQLRGHKCISSFEMFMLLNMMLKMHQPGYGIFGGIFCPWL